MKSSKIVYLKIKGNCGNQFFQYAFARSIQERFGGDLVIDYSWAHDTDPEYVWDGSDNLLKEFSTVDYKYETNDLATQKQKFILNCSRIINGIFNRIYGDKGQYIYYRFCAKYLEKYGIYHFGSSYYPYKYNVKDNKVIYIDGYFESAKYFDIIDNKICSELQPKHALLSQNIELMDKIINEESVCITVKRMDVENPETADSYQYDMSYFYKAMEYIKTKVNNPVWIVFSDKIDWCKNNMNIDGEAYYETDNNPIWEKIRLMSSCKHFIIHNSTFSWWVQHMSNNPNKIVVAPNRWVYRSDGQPTDIYEDNWILLDNKGNVTKEHK